MKKSSLIVDVVLAYIIILSIISIFPMKTSSFVVDIKTFFSDVDIWSIQSYQFEQIRIRLFILIFTVVLAVPGVNKFIFKQLEKIKLPKNVPKIILFLAVSLLFFVLFLRFQTKKPIGATGVFESMLMNDLAFINSNPLSTFFNYALYHVLNGTAIQPWSFIILVANISGLFFIFFLLLLSDALFKKNVEKIIFFAFIVTQGILFLFFGDHDVHSQQLVGIVVYTLFVTLYLRGKCNIALPASAYSLALLLHFSTIIFLPSLLFLPMIKSNKYRKHPIVNFFDSLFSKEFLKLILGALIPIVIFWLFVYLPNQDKVYGPSYGDAFGGGDGTMFVPLFKASTAFEHYTMFSAEHFMDKLNILIFMFPVGVLLWIALALDNRRTILKDKLAMFFLINAVFGLLFITIWNADFGAKLDYNLFSPAILAMSLFAAYELSSNLKKDYYPYIAILAIAVSLFHLLPIIITTA